MIHFKNSWRNTLLIMMGVTTIVFSCQAVNTPFVIKHLGDGQGIVLLQRNIIHCIQFKN